MTDRELLEAAAKAAGKGDWSYCDDLNAMESPEIVTQYGTAHSYWLPLDDDGDALRLAAHLQIDVWHRQGHVGAGHPHKGLIRSFEAESTDRAAATRRAIVRAAAAMVPATPLEGREG